MYLGRVDLAGSRQHFPQSGNVKRVAAKALAAQVPSNTPLAMV